MLRVLSRLTHPAGISSAGLTRALDLPTRTSKSQISRCPSSSSVVTMAAAISGATVPVHPRADAILKYWYVGRTEIFRARTTFWLLTRR